MMDNIDEGKLIEKKDANQSHNEEKVRRIEYPSEKNPTVKLKDLKIHAMKKPREADKHKKISSTTNRPTHQRKYFWPPAPPKRKPSKTVSIHMSNPQAQVVLEERKVEIKDLESQVVYLQKQIKELKAENRTLLDVQNRQSKELKKYCGGITDIPALRRSHNDEIKAIQSNANVVRKELRVCQTDLKSKSELILRKDQEINKLRLVLKNSKQNLQEMTVENKKLEQEYKKLEDETKKLLNENEELKSNSEKMQKTIQQLTNKTAEFEESLSTAELINKQLKDDLKELQKKYDDLVNNEITLKKYLIVSKVMSTTQTDKVETVHAATMTLDIATEPELLSSRKVSVGVQASQDEISPQCTSIELREIEKVGDNDGEEYCDSTASKEQFTAFDIYPDIFCRKDSTNGKLPSQAQRTGSRRPTYSLPHDMSKDTDVKNSYRGSSPLPAYEKLKRQPGLVFDKKLIPLSNNIVFSSTAFSSQGSLNKSDVLMNTSLNLSLNEKLDMDDNLGSYFKESTSKNYHRRMSNQIESSIESNPNGRRDLQNHIGTGLFDSFYDTPRKPSNNTKSRNDLFSNSTFKQNRKYPNGQVDYNC